MNNKVIIITGNKGEGKTTKLLNIIDLLKKENIRIAGFTAVSEWNNGERNKYILVDINSDKSITLCTSNPCEGYKQYGRFFFNPEAIKFGQELLASHRNERLIVVVDEVGPFELENKVWHSPLKYHLENTQNIILLSVRKKLVNDVLEKYNLHNATIYDIEEPIHNIIRKIKLLNY